MKVPMKSYWMGEPIDDMPREKLLEIIEHLGRELEATRKSAQSVIDIQRLALEARSRYR